MKMKSSAALVAVLLAGCGGGGSDVPTAVSASPPAPPASTETPAPVAAAPTPGAAPTPAPVAPVAPPPASPPTPIDPAPQPPTPAPPAATPAPPTPADTVPGPVVWAALETGISPEPGSENPYTTYRRVSNGTTSYYLGGAYTSFVISRVFPGSGFGLWEMVDVKANINGGVIQGVTANGMTLNGPSLDLRHTALRIDATAETWTNGQWFARLVIQSHGELMRVCWNVHLPPPEPVTGPPGFEPVIREPAFKRLACGIYSRTGGPDLGGYISDDYAGTITTYTGRW